MKNITKKILGMVALTSVLATGANADRDILSKKMKNAITMKSCVEAIKYIEETTATSSKYSYTDRTGRQINVNFGVLCSALPEFDEYLNSGKFSEFDVKAYTATANYLLVRSPIPFKKVWFDAETQAGKFDYKKYPNIRRSSVVNLYMASFLYTDYLKEFDDDLNILTSNSYGDATNAGALVRCYLTECDKGDIFGLGNKTFQNLLLLLTQKDYESAQKLLHNFIREKSSPAYKEELNMVSEYIKAKKRFDKNH